MNQRVKNQSMLRNREGGGAGVEFILAVIPLMFSVMFIFFLNLVFKADMSAFHSLIMAVTNPAVPVATENLPALAPNAQVAPTSEEIAEAMQIHLLNDALPEATAEANAIVGLLNHLIPSASINTPSDSNPSPIIFLLKKFGRDPNVFTPNAANNPDDTDAATGTRLDYEVRLAYWIALGFVQMPLLFNNVPPPADVLKEGETDVYFSKFKAGPSDVGDGGMVPG